jgi:hypothetical protein
METLFAFLAFVSFLALLVGLVRPSLVLRWGKNITRGRVALYYGIAFIFFAIIGSNINGPFTTSPSHIYTKSGNEEQRAESTGKQEASEIETKTPEPEKSKEWVVVTELSGKNDKKGDIFTLTGAKCKLTYNADGAVSATFRAMVLNCSPSSFPVSFVETEDGTRLEGFVSIAFMRMSRAICSMNPISGPSMFQLLFYHLLR